MVNVNFAQIILRTGMSLALIFFGFMFIFFPDKALEFYLSALKSKKQSFLARISEQAVKSKGNILTLRFCGIMLILFGIVTFYTTFHGKMR